LTLGVGGGQDILQARYHGIRNITGIELNPQLVELLCKTYADYAGRLLGGETRVQIGDMRGFMEKTRSLLAIHFGFGAVIMVALSLYLLVAVSFPGAGKGERSA
jgi:hypothetical protein